MVLSLPPELLVWTIKLLGKDDIITLRLVSHEIYAVATELLFSHIAKEKPPSIYRAVRDGRLDIAKELMSRYKANVNDEYGGYTPLLLAVKQRDPDAVDLLLSDASIDIHCQNISGQTPLLYSITQGSTAIFERLMRLKTINVNCQDTRGISPITASLKDSQSNIFQTLLSDSRTDVNIRNLIGQTPLHIAVEIGNYGAIQMFVKHSKVLANSRDYKGDTPLHLAVKDRCRPRAIKNVESLFYGHRTGLNHKDRHQRTALWYAVDFGDESLVRILLKHGKLRHEKFELNEVDLLGLTLLARASQNGHLPIVKLLLQQPGICVNAPNQLAVSPLLAACLAGKKPIVDLLLRQASINVNQKGPEGKTALQVAIEMEQFDIAVTLVAWRDNNVSNSPNLQGWSALMFASARGSYGMVQKVLENGKMYLNLVDNQGRTSLWWAAANGHLEVVKLLCAQKGINRRIKDANGDTAYAIAKRRGHAEIMMFWRAP